MQKNISKTLHNFLIISLGNLIYTVAVAFFILPNNLITGGTTGLALFGQYMFHIPITAFVYVFNIAMFLLGAWVLGKAFALTTILSTFEYPFFLSILQLLSSRVGPLTDDMMLATLLPVQVSVSDSGLLFRPVPPQAVWIFHPLSLRRSSVSRFPSVCIYLISAYSSCRFSFRTENKCSTASFWLFFTPLSWIACSSTANVRFS